MHCKIKHTNTLYFSQYLGRNIYNYHYEYGQNYRRYVLFSSFRYSLIRSCCHWNPQHRLSMAELIQKLQAGERSANGRRVLRVPEPLDFEKYMREAGYGEAYNYAVLWLFDMVERRFPQWTTLKKCLGSFLRHCTLKLFQAKLAICLSYTPKCAFTFSC